MHISFILFCVFSTLFSNVSAACNLTAFSSIDAITVNWKNKTEKHHAANFNMMDDFKVIYIAKANATTLCEGMVRFFSYLQELYIIDANISVIEKQAFQDVPNLMKLSLAVNKLTTFKSQYVNQIRKLKVLYLSSNLISSIDEDAFDGMANLERLYLTRNELRSVNGKWFKGCSNLTFVDISHNHIVTIPANAFANIVPNPNWYHPVQYRLSYNVIETISAEAVDASKDFLVLLLDNNKINDLPVPVAKNLMQINTLNLDSNWIECLASEVLEGLKSSFTSLSLQKNPLKCDCVERLNETEVPLNYSTTFNCELLRVVLRN